MTESKTTKKRLKRSIRKWRPFKLYVPMQKNVSTAANLMTNLLEALSSASRFSDLLKKPGFQFLLMLVSPRLHKLFQNLLSCFHDLEIECLLGRET